MHQWSLFMIVIVDHVGKNAGNNYYSDGLCSAINDAGHKGLILSNYESKFSKKIFIGNGKISFFIGSLFLLIKLISFQIYKPKIIFHCFNGNYKVLLLARTLSIFTKKLICIAHDPKSIITSDDSYKKEIFDLCDVILVHNEYSKNELLKAHNSISKKLIYVVNHGINLARFKRADKDKSRASIGVSDDKFIMLFFGQVKSSKNLKLVIDSLPLIKDINPLVLVYGKFVEEDASFYSSLIPSGYEEYVRIVPGFVSDDLMKSLFSASDVSILPYKEIFQSGVILTSFAYNLPVICSDIPGFSSIVSNSYNGFLFKNNNIKDFSRSCHEAYNSDLKLISENSILELKKRFSWESSVEILNREKVL